MDQYKDICLIDCEKSTMTFRQVMDAIAAFRARYDCDVYVEGGTSEIRARVFGPARRGTE